MQTLQITQRPSINSDVSFKARVISNQFGDGYRQTAADGLNSVARTWMLSWDNLTIADANVLEAFLVSHVGQPFYYLMPREQYPRAWDCTDWTRGYPAGAYDSFKATFNERFDLA